MPLDVHRPLDRAIQEKIYEEREAQPRNNASQEGGHHLFHELLPVLFWRRWAFDRADVRELFRKAPLVQLPGKTRKVGGIQVALRSEVSHHRLDGERPR